MSTDAPAPPAAARPPRPCPVCGKTAVMEFRPFCSRGCRDRDLLAWFGEDYRVPGEAAGAEDEPNDG